jgi:VanZ family protein
MNWKKALALLWTLGILAACTVPGQSLPDVSLFEFDKLIHFALFAVFGWLWMAALQATARGLLLTLAGGVAYAVLTEFYQAVLPYARTPDPADALANALGLGAGVLLFHLRKRKSS